VALNHDMSGATLRFMPERDWQARAARHRERVAPWVDAHLQRCARREKHPVYDFLFQYYSYPARHLLRWSPGLDVVLEGAGARAFLQDRHFMAMPAGVMLDERRLPAHRLTAINWIARMLEATASRPPRFGCFGLHEWAMVYRAGQRRHGQLPLRVAPDALDRLVESQPVACSHYDAFRFFTPEARPLNRLRPERQDRAEWEQPGCLHANMDLYKWALKFQPWIDGELLADTFLLALRVRELDMRASPYDLSALGFAPVAVETADGRTEYARQQRALSAEAEPLRLRLIDVYRELARRCEGLRAVPAR
jgi:hypothetical protein